MTDPDDGAAPPARWDHPTAPASPNREPSPPVPHAGGSPFDPPRRERFVERGELGRGGMGRVIEATDTTLDRPVAIKQMLSTELVDQIRFEREVRITARLQHPSIVPILDAGRDAAGKPYYVMRKIEGRPLAERVTEATAVRDRLALVPNVLAAVDAVAYAHARGVIHRDLKPWNVLIGPFGETLVIDWGLARELAAADDATDAAPVVPASTPPDTLTRLGDAYGTPGFMAPEQARGEPSDRGADVYALGATLYHLLAGATPFAGGSATDAIDRAAAGDRPDASKIPSEVPAELVAIVTKAMAPARTDRYLDAGELATDLRRFLAGQLVAAHRYTVGERLIRFVRRHRVAVAIGAIAATAIIVTAVLAVRRVVHERDTATAARADARDRADQLLIGRARALLATDPTATLALLKNLDPASPHWIEARAIASAAAAGWIERGVAIHDDRVTAVELAPDGGHALSTGVDGRVVVTELATLRFRELARLGPIYDATWIEGGRAIACMTDTAIIRVDATTGAHATLVERPRIMWIAAPGHADRLVYSARESVEQIATTPGSTPTVLVADGSFAAGTHGVVIGDTTSVRWLNPAGVATVIGPPLDRAGTLFQLADGPDARFAVLLGTTAIELELVDGAPVERRRWEVPATSQLVYLGRYLYAHTDGYRIALGDRGTRIEGTPVPAGRGQVVTTRAGTVVADPLGTGRIWITDTTATRELHHHPMMLTALAGTPAARWLVAGTSRGELRIWAIPVAATHTFSTPQRFPLLAVQDDTIYLAAGDAVVAFDIATGAKRELPVPSPPQLAETLCLDGDTVALRAMPGAELVVVEPAQEERRYPLATCADAGTTTWLTWGDGDDQWIAPLTDPDRKRLLLTTRDPIIAVSITTHWTLALHDSGGVTRIDLDTGAVAQATVADVRAMALDATGVGWFAVGDATHLVRWDGARTMSSTLPAAAVVLRQRSRGGVHAIASDGTIRVIAANGTTERIVGRPGTRPLIDFAGRVATYRDDDQVVIVDLDTGTPVIYRPSNMPAEVKLDPSGHRVAVQLLQKESVVEVWDDPVPTDPGQLRRWVEASTNATMAVGSEIVTWVAPP